MKIRITFICLIFLTFSLSAQKFVDGKGFNSVFQDLISGNFEGTSNGVLFIKNGSSETILDFQGSYSKLEIKVDTNEVYDVSYKNYIGKTTSGNTEVKYETYATANGISIKLNGNWYVLTGIDGACDLVINGLEYKYKAEKTAEYLILRVTKTLELEIETDNSVMKGKTISLLPDSTLIFAIKRK